MDTPRKNLNWLWYFLTLAAMTVLAVAILVVYNLNQQLKKEHIDAAIALWKTNGHKNYVLVYTAKKTEKSNEMTDHYVVKVKDGQTYEVLVNGLPLDSRQHGDYGMGQLLRAIERFKEIDSEPGRPKTYTRGVFDGRTGALAWYVRRVMGTRQRLEITVESLESK